MKESCNSTCQCAKEESKNGGTKTAAGELPIVGRGIGGEGVGDGGKHSTREAVDQAPKGTRKVLGREGGKDRNEEADGGVGQEEAGGEQCSRLEREPLEPRTQCGEKSKEAACPYGAPRNLHRSRMPLVPGGGKPRGINFAEREEG